MAERRNLLMAAGSHAFRVPAVQYTGSQYLTGQGSSTPRVYSSNTTGTISTWFRFDGGNGAKQIIWAGSSFLGSTYQFSKEADNKFRLYFSDPLIVSIPLGGGPASSNGGIFQFTSSNAYVASATWHHLMAAWNKSGDIQQMYIDGVSDCTPITPDSGSTPHVALSNFFTNSGPSQLYIGGMSQFWMDDTYMDISVLSNRQKFALLGKPVDLGSDGSLTTGITPLVFLNGDYSHAGQNAGRAVDFNVTGTPLNTGTPS